MLLKLIYIVIVLVVLVVFQLLNNKNSIVLRGDIHHYNIYDTLENHQRIKDARDFMKKILYGQKYEPSLPKGIHFHWQEPPGNGFNIFPGYDGPLVYP